ncbi:peptide/nickel transport system ATP-binding protein [Paraburkholderia sp. BL23I1N1]|uniref:ABC transporter n=2 Tax=Paraburkholderia TaxID=1822464 RepID=A0A2N7WW55_9BURK|nr:MULTISPECIES: ABC transporter ATP-binding protein [Paraburkholderia]MBC8749803.1 ABC transporter ATP-binding protein [Paraburkholderia podalyriae]PMS33728.1 ABC transporter [Paraburkholderia rhynchosiae]REE18560.1 peptide/nickel transport system ATP-binding protein [Paraburkholderia sp. BL27I4N3]RKE35574.1 peptide/nickel transport system ATP-binding protein [Paraburkholderia sp. BL23I1N1]CAB3670040.1 Glutathione import ATP-binding protein GsiA [Paraburkholderia rhynchosiae]
MTNRNLSESDVILHVEGLVIDGFSKGQWHRIIDDIDLRVHRGEVVGLIGESGSGKSTLGLAAMGYVRPGCRIVSGKVEFLNRNLVTASESERLNIRGSQITYVAQSAAASFNPSQRLIRQTVESAVVHGIKTRRNAARDAKDMFRALLLPEPEQIGRRYPHQVSGGQLQRVMTAMAMSPEPNLIIFDEPTTALDVTTQIEVLAAIKDVVERYHVAAIFVTHDLAIVSQMATRLMVLHKGKCVEEAPTREMIDEPKHEYTRSLWAVRSLEKPFVANQSREVFLKLEGVSAHYGSVKVLDQITMTIPKGRTVAIVGESGSGKSTIARVIAGLLIPSSGEVVLEDRILPSSYVNRSREQLRRVQMIYQMADTALNPHHTVRDILARPLAFYSKITDPELSRRVSDLLKKIELDDSFASRRPSELSGGQRQRVSIARALAASPELIICDEITSALDQVVQEGVLKLLMKLQREFGVTYIFITHDLGVVKAISDEVVVMQNGRIVDQGSKEAIMAPPYAPYTELLLSSVPQTDPGWLDSTISQRRPKGSTRLKSSV